MNRRIWQCAAVTILVGLTTFHFAFTANPPDVEIVPVEKPEQFDSPQPQALLVQSGALIRAAEARAAFDVDGAGFACAVLDTGLRTTHNDFTGRVVAQRNETSDNDGDAGNASDGHGHGTNVCGIVCANGSHIGIAPGADVIPVKVLQNTGGGDFAQIADGLQWVINNRLLYNITVVNMSLGSNQNVILDDFDFDGIKAKIQALRAANVAVVVSAGNSFFGFASVEGMAFPVIVRETVSVGAVYDANIGPVSYGSGAVANTTAADRITPFSQRLHESTNAATRTDIFAPGAALTSSGNLSDNGESTMHGTSQAAPVTAGAILLMQQHYKRTHGVLPSVTELENILRSTAVTVNDGDDENDNVINTGKNYLRLDVYAALEEIGPPAEQCFLENIFSRLPVPAGLLPRLAGRANVDRKQFLADVRQFRDDVLNQSADGRLLRDLYYQQGSELIRLAALHPHLAKQTCNLLLEQQAALVDACQTGVVNLPAARFADGLELIERFQGYASDDLSGDLLKAAMILKKRAEIEGDFVKLDFRSAAAE